MGYTPVKVVVAGRGIMGLWVALRLRQAGFQVRLIGPDQGRGSASYAAVGLSAVKGLVLSRDVLFRQKLRGHQQRPALIRKLEQLSGKSISHHFNGVFEFFQDPEHYAALRERVFHGEFTGCFRFRVLGRRDLFQKPGPPGQALFPDSGKIPAGALYYPGDGWFHPVEYLQALEQAFVRAGGKLLSGTLEDLVEDAGRGFRFVVKGQDGGRGLADEIVLAAGGETGALVRRWCGLDPGLKLSGGVSLVCEGGGFRQKDPQTIRSGRYSLHAGPDGLRCGSADFIPGGGEGPLVRAAGQLYSFLGHYMGGQRPCEHDCRLLRGLRARTKDRRPLCLRKPLKGGRKEIYIVSGLHKNGFDFAPDLAGLITNQLTKGGQLERAPGASLGFFV